MNIQHALLPHKHVRFSESLLAVAGYVRTLLIEPRTIDELWALIGRDDSGWPSTPTFTHLVYAVDVLFAIGQIELCQDDRIKAAAP